MAIAPVPLLLGWLVAGSIHKTILETSATAKVCLVLSTLIDEDGLKLNFGILLYELSF